MPTKITKEKADFLKRLRAIFYLDVSYRIDKGLQNIGDVYTESKYFYYYYKYVN